MLKKNGTLRKDKRLLWIVMCIVAISSFVLLALGVLSEISIINFLGVFLGFILFVNLVYFSILTLSKK